MRYDERTERYVHCKWCSGKGCLYCKSEADKDYKAAFPDGPQPIATFNISTPDGQQAARDFLNQIIGKRDAAT